MKEPFRTFPQGFQLEFMREFEDTPPKTIINTMLVRFNEIFTNIYIEKASELGMSIDDVITLASIIEREASAESGFTKVSAVFHNRLREEMKLESCATMQYALKANKYTYTKEELETDSPYKYLPARMRVSRASA